MQDLGPRAGGRGSKHGAFTDTPARFALVRDHVANLLRNVPGRIALDLPTIATSLAAVSPVAAGMTTKRLANIRSDFLAAARASGLIPIGAWHKGRLASAWRQLFARLSQRRAHLGLSRFARYASAQGIDRRRSTM